MPPASYSLATAPLAAPHWVQAVQPPPGAPEWLRWLEDIGFLPGERVCVLSRAQPGDDPMRVRIGQSTFALRRAEAACVAVMPVSCGQPR